MPDFDLDQALAVPQNTKLRYMYRDAGNWKTHAEVVLSGRATMEDFAPFLGDAAEPILGDDVFIACDVGLEELQFEHRGGDGLTEDDHVWHELVAVEPTEEEGYGDSVEDMLERFRSAHARGWLVHAAVARLGIP